MLGEAAGICVCVCVCVCVCGPPRGWGDVSFAILLDKIGHAGHSYWEYAPVCLCMFLPPPPPGTPEDPHSGAVILSLGRKGCK